MFVGNTRKGRMPYLVSMEHNTVAECELLAVWQRSKRTKILILIRAIMSVSKLRTIKILK